MNLRAILVGGVAAVGNLTGSAVFEVTVVPAAAQEIQTAEDQKQLEAWRKLSDEASSVVRCASTERNSSPTAPR